MPLSKSLRFQILRRDNHTCRYCGATAPDAKIGVDHVVAVALGGTDEPTNLVACCQPCNAGKDATPADAAVVEDVKQDALRWAAAIELAAEAAQAKLVSRQQIRQGFLDEWKSWTFGADNATIDLPANWRNSIDRFIDAGMTVPLLQDCVRIAMRSPISPYKTFRYMCGVAWNRVRDLQDAAREIVVDAADG